VTAGLAAEAAGNEDKAFTDYQNAVAKNPSNEIALYDLGHIYQQRGNTTDAADNYRAALRIDPTFADALYNMGVLESNIDPASAIEYFMRDLHVDATNASADFNLGVLLIRQGKSTQGYSALETGLRLNPALASDLPPGISVPPTTTTTG
jgi:tetratricopeptide (TPR) repeat protein